MPILSRQLNETTTQPGTAGSGGRLVSVEGKELPLRSAALTCKAAGGLARTVLEQVFSNPHDEPLKLTYTMPLPADGAVSGYEIRMAGRTIRGEIDKVQAARKRYEKALLQGRTAGLLEQDRTSVFRQELGNVPPKTEVTVALTVDQPLRWLDEGMWEWRFPTVAAPRYMGAPGRVADEERVTVDVAGGDLPVRASLGLSIGDTLAGTGRPESPSHSITTARTTAPSGESTAEVSLGERGAALNKDIVIRWPVARPEPGVSLRTARPGEEAPHGGHAYGLLTLVPPAAPDRVITRDLILLIDTSGSMTGGPLEQARRVAGLLVDSLTEQDSLEMIEFSGHPHRWRHRPVEAGPAMKRLAHDWLASLHAGGCTEMSTAVQQALGTLREGSQRQVVLITDGMIGFEQEVVDLLVDRLPQGCRLHSVGVGPAMNRSLTGAAARAGRGREILVSLDEDTEKAARRLVAATRAPVITELVFEGSAFDGCAPERPRDLMAGEPVLAGIRLNPSGGQLVVRGTGPDGPWDHTLEVPAVHFGEGNGAVTALFGREAVEDLEARAALERTGRETDRQIEEIGLQFQISTRLTSWVAVSEERDVEPKAPIRTERIPQMLPEGLSSEGLGLGARSGVITRFLSVGSPLQDSLARACLRDADGLPEIYETEEEALQAFGAEPSAPPRRTHRAAIRPEPSGVSRPGFVRRFLDLFGFGGEEGLPEMTRPAMAARWAGRLENGLFVLEFQVEAGALDWYPALKATVRTRQGGVEKVEVDRDASTRRGTVPAGASVRLALRVSEGMKDRIVALTLPAGAETIGLEVRPE